MKRQKSIIDKLLPIGVFGLIILLWLVLSTAEVIPAYMLPSPVKVIQAFIADFDIIMEHAGYTLAESALGLVLSIAIGFVCAVVMDRFVYIKKAFYPLLVITQTVPVIAIAPLLILWFSYGMAPKILLVIIVCFFPMTVGFLDGFASADPDEIKLLRSMGANSIQVFRHLKLPHSLPHFFAGLKISASYCILAAVTSEWLGGVNGLGVYMTRVKKSYAFDKMFAVIILVSVLSLLLMGLISLLEKKLMPYRNR